MQPLPYLAGYPEALREEAGELLRLGRLLPLLESKYPDRHEVNSTKALGGYVQELKAKHMRNSQPLGQVRYDNRLHAVRNALGLHTTRTQVQGSKLRKRREMRIASLFKDAAPEFLRMIVVHELAHMKHADHSADFYKLCTYMEPEYHRLELDLRLWLTAREESEP